MWILQWLPNWIFYGIFFAGLLGLLATYVMKFIPFVYVYRTPIQAVSVLAIAIGTYMSGAISNEESWKAKVNELQAKVAAAEVESQKENIKVVEKVVKKTEYITRRGQDIIQYVDKEVVKYDERFKPGGQCELPKEFIKAINNAAEAPK
jgi:translation elongation factor EF-Tu-like GTPase